MTWGFTCETPVAKLQFCYIATCGAQYAQTRAQPEGYEGRGHTFSGANKVAYKKGTLFRREARRMLTAGHLPEIGPESTSQAW
jgi:hypothetical protein